MERSTKPENVPAPAPSTSTGLGLLRRMKPTWGGTPKQAVKTALDPLTVLGTGGTEG